jgi:hypothetical protein
MSCRGPGALCRRARCATPPAPPPPARQQRAMDLLSVFFLSAAQDPRPKSATKVLVARGAPRAPVKNGAKKRVKPRRARTRRDAQKTTQRPRISSFDPHAHQLSIARLRSGRSAREGHWRAYTLPPKNRRYSALGLFQFFFLFFFFLTSKSYRPNLAHGWTWGKQVNSVLVGKAGCGWLREAVRSQTLRRARLPYISSPSTCGGQVLRFPLRTLRLLCASTCRRHCALVSR